MAPGRRTVRGTAPSGSATIRAPASAGIPHAMPNIKQQEKRVRIAARQRLENLRYRSTIKTLTKRLETRSPTATPSASRAEHRELVRVIDRRRRAARSTSNTAARKKAQAARLVAAG